MEREMRLTERQIRQIVRGVIREQTDDENEQLVDQPQEMMIKKPSRIDIPSMLPNVELKTWESLEKSSRALESAIEVTIERYYADDSEMVEIVNNFLAAMNVHDEGGGHAGGFFSPYDIMQDFKSDLITHITGKIDSGEGGMLGRLAKLIKALVDRSTQGKYEISTDGISNLIADVIGDKVHRVNQPSAYVGQTIGGQIARWINVIGEFGDVGYVVPKQITGPTEEKP
jgi:hypothetical protein